MAMTRIEARECGRTVHLTDEHGCPLCGTSRRLLTITAYSFPAGKSEACMRCERVLHKFVPCHDIDCGAPVGTRCRVRGRSAARPHYTRGDAVRRGRL
jgi:hypothetical protein